jgi:peptidoglycan/xylan/chitin deacetylase (PgdA/CDA1 family)
MMRMLIRGASRLGGRGRLSIFIFHRVLAEPDPLFPRAVDRAAFDQLVGWITRWFTVLPLHEALRQLRDDELPAAAAAITFDDGYADNLEQAEPVLRKHGACATLFVATGFLDGGCMWNDRVIEAVRRTRRDQLDLPALLPQPVALGGIEQRRAAVGQLIGAIKYLEPAARQAAVADVVAAAGISLPTDLMLTRENLRRWHRAGQQVGAHTVSHPILARLPDDEARSEIARGRTELEAIVDERVGLFAYPNGRPGVDYLPQHVSMVRELGFDGAVSTTWGVATNRSASFELPRFTPWDRTPSRFGLRMLRQLLAS